MGDIEELKNLVAQQARDTASLIAEMARMRAAPAGPAHVPDPDAAAAALVVARADKVSKLGVSLRKSYKVKEFKDNNEKSVKEWLTRWDQEVNTLKKMCNITDDLTRG